MYARFKSPPLAAPQPRRKDSRDIFAGLDGGDDSGGSWAKETLLSFPSVTDSEGRSEDAWDEEELERQKARARANDRGRSTVISSPTTTHTTNNTTNSSSTVVPSPRSQQASTFPRPHIPSLTTSNKRPSSRKYPKGDGEDDREESVSLFKRDAGETMSLSEDDMAGLASRDGHMSVESGDTRDSLEEPPLTLREGGIRLVSQGNKSKDGVS
jgi:hypothetical protein